MLSELHQCLGVRRSTVFTITATVVSTVFTLTTYKLWKQRCERKKDDELFGDITESPLFNPDVSFPKKEPIEGFNGDRSFRDTDFLSIAEREEALKLARGMLQQIGMEDDAEENSKSDGSDSEKTDVSLNYHIAVELEKEARDSLIQAVIQGKLLEVEAKGESLMLNDCADVLVKAVEYLDISNEREKLRERRSTMCINSTQKRTLLWGDDADQNNSAVLQRKAIDAAYEGFFRRPAEIDRYLHDSDGNGMNERFEMGWEDGDNDGTDEVDLMAYLDKDDAAGYGSRMEARMGTMMEHELELIGGVDDVYGDYDDEDDEEEGEEDNLDYDIEKAEFERMLLNRLNQLATSIGKGGDKLIGAAENLSGAGCQRLPVAAVEGQKGVKEGDRSADEWETERDSDEENTEALELESHANPSWIRSRQ